MPGSPDLVDVDFEIEEGLPGQFGGSLGFSETYGVTLGGNFIHSNFMGTGRRVALELRGGEYQKVYDINFTDPYRNIDGVARTISLTYQDITQYTSVTSDFSTTTLSAGMNWSYPDRELPAPDVRLLVSGFRAPHEPATARSRRSSGCAATASRSPSPGGFDRHEGQEPGHSSPPGSTTRATRRCFRRPARACRSGFNAAVPGSDVEYYVASVDFTKYIPHARAAGCSESTASSSYGDAYGDTTAIPPFRNRYARRAGLRARLQGKLSRARGTTSAIRTAATCCSRISSSWSFRRPAKIAGSTRIALFFDVGNVFSTGGVNFFDKLGDPIDYGFDYDKLKKSVGLGVEWLAPLGLLRFSYAMPLNEDAATDRFYGDEVERFQFSIGNAF